MYGHRLMASTMDTPPNVPRGNDTIVNFLGGGDDQKANWNRHVGRSRQSPLQTRHVLRRTAKDPDSIWR